MPETTIIVKSVKQAFSPTPELLQMMETFRLMVNDCIRIGIRSGKTSMKSLGYECRPTLKRYTIRHAYKDYAISKAAGILKRYHKDKKHDCRVSIPHCRKPFLNIGYWLRLNNNRLILPPDIEIVLNAFTIKMVGDHRIRSVTVTNEAFSVSYETIVVLNENIRGVIGLDRNLGNVSTVDSNGIKRIFDMQQVPQIKLSYKNTKSHFTRNDVRIMKLLYRKYGKKQRNRIHQRLHHVSNRIVQYARQHSLAIALEDLKGIGRLYRRGNGQGNYYRGRMNGWPFYELERQITYKAVWEGIRVIKVRAWGTSTKCSVCGQKTKPEESRKLYCPHCKVSIDRDINAAKNIMKRGLEMLISKGWFSPVGLAGEAMVQEPGMPVILKVDASQSRNG